ncbi:MAG: hypothetical protein AMS27_13710 [Bacteroides sp. SM23_62_1]|nr:MAG: hypothetical protein AMS27_13710 [Bacteroides sp. SM23_62_1]
MSGKLPEATILVCFASILCSKNHNIMKRYISLIIVFLVSVMTFSSCEENGPSGPADEEIPKITLNLKALEIIKADQAFGFELFREVYNLTEKDNIMISPLSVSYALGMTYNGAAGTTLDAFNDVLHFDDLTTREVNESYKDLMDQLVHLDEQVEFSIANSIWYRLGFEVLSEFIQTNKDYFDAEVKDIDFNDPQTVEIINQWIEDKTNDKIQDMLPHTRSIICAFPVILPILRMRILQLLSSLMVTAPSAWW